MFFAQFRQTARVGRIFRPDYQQGLHLIAQGSDCYLTISRRIAEIAANWALDIREMFPKGIDNVLGFRNRKRRLRNVGEFRPFGEGQFLNVIRLADQSHAAFGYLAQMAFHFRVARMAYQNHVTSSRMVTFGAHVNALHQRTRRIQHVQMALLRFFVNRIRYAVRRENDSRPFRDFLQVFDKDRTLSLKAAHDKSIMHNFMAHINRGTEFFERLDL